LFSEDAGRMLAGWTRNGGAANSLQPRHKMERLMSPKTALAAAVSLLAVAAPAAAQNSTAPPPIITVTPPPTRTETPPAPPAPSPPATTQTPASPTEPAEPSPPETVVVEPQPQRAPAEPVTIDPDAAYPEGFADPEDPFANDMADSYRQDGGFDWGLLGLLGLLGLIPLLRGPRGERIVYVERDEEPRRVVRRDRVD
jgi:hypothetical protein